MFLDFFYQLRRHGVPTSTNEYFDLLKALQKAPAGWTLERFYRFARSILVKDVKYYDSYDIAFAETFKDLPWDPSILGRIESELMEWLNHQPKERIWDEEELAKLEALDLDELRRRFQERLAEQKEQHDGGSHWVGTGGTSPFGHSGRHPSGIRVGGASQNRSAIQVAEERRFQGLRSDLVLDVRQFQSALRQLKVLTRDDGPMELDLDETIQKTCRNGGDIDLVMRRARRNRVKLLLLMDVGGSMDPYARTTSLLFSAAHKSTHFKAFQSYYFHNCPYETLQQKGWDTDPVSTAEVVRDLDASWQIIIVGDAAMAPNELLDVGGSISYFHFNRRTGMQWLQDFRTKTDRIVWLNPDPPRFWNSSYTCQVLQQVFPMYPLTVNGLHDAIEELRLGRRKPTKTNGS